MKSLAESTSHLSVIDGLRGIAILMVMANHWGLYGVTNSNQVFLWSESYGWVRSGHFGVLLFFFVSSFTLFHSAYSRRASEKNFNRNFFIRRFFRIAPLWWVSVIIYTAILNRAPLGEHVWCCFPMLFGFSSIIDHPVPGAWTLFVEETFYVLFPLVITFVTTFSRAVALFVASYAIKFIWIYYFSSIARSFGISPTIFPFYHWYAFSLGIVMFFAYRDRGFNLILHSKKLGIRLTLIMPLMVALCLPGKTWGDGDDLAAFALIVVFVTCMNSFSFWGKLARARWLGSLGICCYSLYLLHAVALSIAAPRVQNAYWLSDFRTLPFELEFVITYPLFVWGCFFVCRWVFTGFEKPCVNLGKAIIARLSGDGLNTASGMALTQSILEGQESENET